jgi:hypothetical protein
VDELFSLSSIDRSSHYYENRSSTEERANFRQGNLNMYTLTTRASLTPGRLSHLGSAMSVQDREADENRIFRA